MIIFCSVAGKETIAQTRVLAASLRSHHPGARVVVCLVGEGLAEARAEEQFESLVPGEVGVSERCEMSVHRPGMTLHGLPPKLLEYALAEDANVAAYLDPQICVYATLEPVLAVARQAGIALVRRLTALPEDGKRPNDADLLAVGRISPAFVATGRGEEGKRFLLSWSRRAEQGEVPARWLDIAPDLFPRAVTIEDRGCNVSPWNLHERTLERHGDEILAAGQKLRFFDFMDFRPDRPYWFGDRATRVLPMDDPVLAELCGDYAERVRGAGWLAPRTHSLGDERLGNGLPLDSLIRGLWAEARASGHDFGDPSSPLAAEAFAAWAREPAEHGGAAGVNRYLLAAYRGRPDLQRVFSDLDAADGPSLIAWGWEHGRHEMSLSPELLPAAPQGIALADEAEFAVKVMGYLRDTLGLAEAARQYIQALSAAGVPVSTMAIAPDLPVDPAKGHTITRFGHHPHEELQTPFEPAFNLVCVNGDQLDAFIRAGGADALGDRPTIGQWAWETDVLPPSWIPGFAHLDEIWVNSSFVAENLARLSPVPVVLVPQAISVPDPAGVELELARDGRFTFLYMLDFFSTLQRKNPVGLIDAFTRTFAPGEGPRLLLKTINAKFRPQAAEELRWKIGDRTDIELVDRYLEPRQNAALLARADCYVSLHRSEGFGLALAESMALGTPVIATGYSGNTDFTTARNSYLVDWVTTRVGPDCEIYPADGTWAEPDLDHAAELMRRVWERPAEAREKAERACIDIHRRYAPAVAGRVARARLERLREPRRRREVSPGGALAAIERELTFDIRRGAPVRHGPAGLARRAALRVMLPFTVHERNLDRALLDALRELRTDLDRERARGARVGVGPSTDEGSGVSIAPDQLAARRDARDRHGMRVLLSAVLARDGQAVDVGAHSGAVLREILRVAPGGHHIAYEPLPDCCDLLRREFPQVDVREAALSDQNGTTSFIHVEHAPEYSGMLERTYPGHEDSPRRELTVRTERLDDVLPRDFRPSLIKIDVEGAELLVMRGAIETLRRFRPAVIFEHGIGAAERYGYGPQDVHDLLCRELGMRIFDLDGEGPYTRERFIEVFPRPIWNFVGVPG